jgi:hypothetical protein
LNLSDKGYYSQQNLYLSILERNLLRKKVYSSLKKFKIDTIIKKIWNTNWYAKVKIFHWVFVLINIQNSDVSWVNSNIICAKMSNDKILS